MKRAPALKATYVGNGLYISGVPARDLTDEDWAALSEEQWAQITGSGLYDLADAVDVLNIVSELTPEVQADAEESSAEKEEP